MKTLKLILGLGLFLVFNQSIAQNNNSVGINTSSPNPNAVLELESPTKDQGFLVPRLTPAQRGVLRAKMLTSSGNEGMMVYDIALNQFYYWDGEEWVQGLGGFNGATAGGSLTGTYPNPLIRLGGINNPNMLISEVITTTKIRDENVTTDKLANQAVTYEKIQTSTVTPGSYGNEFSVVRFEVNDRGIITVAEDVVIQIDSTNIIDLGIIGDDIANGTIPITKIDPQDLTDKVMIIGSDGVVRWEDRLEFTSSQLNQNNIYIGDASNRAEGLPVTGDVTAINNGASANITINDNTIATENIIDGEVQTVDIDDLAVTNAKLGPDAVTTDKIAPQNVQTSDIADLNVTNVKLGPDAVTTDKIQDGQVQNEDLDKPNIPISGFGAGEADIDIGDNRLINVTDPVDLQDAATKNYVDVSIDADNDLDRGYIFVGDENNEATRIPANGDGFVLVGDGEDVNSVEMTGDVEIDSTGATTIQDNAIQGDDIDVTSGSFIVDGPNQVIFQNTDGVAITNDASVGGNFTANSQVNLSSTTESTNVLGELNVDGATNLNDGANITGSNLIVNTNSELNGDLDVNGGTFTIDGTDPSSVNVTDNDVTLSTTTSGDVNISAADDVNISGTNVNVSGSFSPDNLDVDGLTQLDETQINTTDGNLFVDGSGSVDIDVPVDISQQTDLAGSGISTNVRGDLNVTEQATFTDNVDANNGLDVSGAALTITSQQITQTGTSQVSFGGNVDAQNGVDVTGGDLTVATNTDLNGDLSVDGTTFSIDGTSASNVSVTGNDLELSTLGSGGDINISAIDDVNISGTNINVSGSFSPDNLDVDGLTQLDETQINTTDGNLFVDGSGSVDIDVPVDISQQTDLAGLGISTNVRGDLNVTEQATFTDNVDANNGLDVSGAALNVTSQQITQTGTSQVTFGGNVDAQNGVDVTGGDLTVATNTDLNGDLTVDGTSFSLDGSTASNVSVSDDDLELSTLGSSGDINISAIDDVNITATNINVTGSFSPDNLDVDGLTQLDETQINTDDGDLVVTGSGAINIDVPVDISQQTDLAASGISTNVRGDLNVTEQATFTDNIDAQNGLDVTGSDLTVGTNADFDGTLDVAGQVDLGSTSDNTNVRGDLNVAQDLDITDNLSFDGSAPFVSEISTDVRNNNDATDLATADAIKTYVDEEIDADNDLTQGHIFVGDGTGEAVELDARGDGFILQGDGTDLVSKDIADIAGNGLSRQTATDQLAVNVGSGLQIDNDTVKFDIVPNQDEILIGSSANEFIAGVVGGDVLIEESGGVVTSTIQDDAVDGGDLDVTSGNFVVTGANQIQLNNTGGLLVANDTDLDGDLIVDGATISLDATNPSNFTVDGNDLTIQTTSSGDIVLDPAGSVNITEGRTLSLSTDDAESLTSDGTNLDVTSGGDINLTATSNTVIANAVEVPEVQDSNDNEVLIFGSTGSAVNEVTITNAATAGDPVISSSGDDANVGLTINTQGSGDITIDPGAGVTNLINADLTDANLTSPNIAVSIDDLNGEELFTLTPSGTPVNQLEIENADVGSGPVISTAGDDTNIDLNLQTKGTGDINIEAGTGAVSIEADGASTINVESNDLTLSTTTSGDLVLSAADRVNIPQSTELSLSTDDAENIVSDGTDLTLSSGSDINLNPTNNVNITEGRSMSLSTDDAESLTSDGTNLDVTSGGDINLTATSNTVIANAVEVPEVQDGNDNEVLIFGSTGSAVNEVTVTNAATAGDPVISSSGDDANVGLTINTQGSGDITIDPGTGVTNLVNADLSDADLTSPNIAVSIDDLNGEELFTLTPSGTPVNQLEIQNADAASGPVISTAGDDTNIDLNLQTKGTGDLNLNPGGDVRVAQGTALSLSTDDAENLSSDGTDLSVASGGDITLNSTGNVNVPQGTTLSLATDDAENLSSDGTDLSIASGGDIVLSSTGNVNVPQGTTLSLSTDDAENIVSDGTDVTLSSGSDINLNPTNNVNITEGRSMSLSTDDAESLTSDGTNLDVTSGGDINLTATSNTVIANAVEVPEVQDGNDNEVLIFGSTGSAVNEVTVTNAATAGDPVISSSGDDANVGLTINTQGSGDITIDPGTGVTNLVNADLSDADLTSPNIAVSIDDLNGEELFTLTPSGTPVNQLEIQNADAASGPVISTAGDDTNIDLNLQTKGTGDLNLNPGGDVRVAQGTALSLSTDDAENLSSDGTDLSVASGGDITLNSTGNVNVPQGTTLSLATDDAENLSSDGTDLSIASGGDIVLSSTGNVNVPQGTTLSLSTDDAENIVSDGTDVTLSSGSDINLNPTNNVNITEGRSMSLSTDDAESLTSDGTNLDVTSGGDINLTATSNTVIANAVEVPEVQDGNDNEVLIFGSTGSAVNEVTVTNAATAGDPVISSSGDDANVGLTINTQGSGDITIDPGTGVTNLVNADLSDADLTSPNIAVSIDDLNGEELFTLTPSGTPVNQLEIQNADAASGPVISTAGDDTNIDLNLQTKGTGDLNLNPGGDVRVAQGTALSLSTDDAENLSSDGTDLSVASGGDITLNSTGNVNVPQGTTLSLATDDAENLSSDGTDLSIASGGDIVLSSTGNVNVPQGTTLSLSTDDAENIVSDGTDVTLSSGSDINLNPTNNVNITEGRSMSLSTDDAESLTSDGTNLDVTSGGDINLTATSNTVIANAVEVPEVQDGNDNEVLIFGSTGSAVNEVTVTNAATAGDPVISSSGDDANVGLTINTQGSGDITIDPGTGVTNLVNADLSDADLTSPNIAVSIDDLNGEELFTLTPSGTPVNQLEIQNADAASGPVISTAGDDTNIDLNLQTKGTGDLNLNPGGDVRVAQGTALSLSTDDAENLSSDGTDLSVASGGDITLNSTGNVNVPQGTTLSLATDDAENLSSDGTDLSIASGGDIVLSSTGNVNVPQGTTLSLSTDDAENIVSDGTDVTLSSGSDINLNPTNNVNITEGRSMSLSTDDAESLTSDGTNLDVTSGGDINLTATSNTVIANAVEVPEVQDGNDNEVLIFGSTGSAVNEVTVTNAATAGDPVISSSGDDANVGLTINTQGSGDITIDPGTGVTNLVNADLSDADLTSPNIAVSIDDLNGEELFTLTPSGTPVNQLEIQNADAASGPVISTAGDDTNIDLNLQTKGTGDLNLNPGGDVRVAQGTALSLSTDDAENLSSDGTDLSVASGGDITLNSTGNVNVPQGTTLSLATDDAENLSSDGTDLSIASGGDIVLSSTGNVNVPQGTTLSLSTDDAENIVSDGTDVTLSSGSDINLNPTNNVNITEGRSMSLSTDDAESLTSDGTNLDVTSGGDINLTATSNTVIANAVEVPEVQDGNDNEVLIFGSTGSAVNEVTVTNAATAGDPVISSSGDDANVGLTINTQGSGDITIDPGTGVTNLVNADLSDADLTSPNIAVSIDDLNGEELFTLTPSGTPVNQLEIQNADAASGPVISTAGDDTNIDLNLQTKGAGDISLEAGTGAVSIEADGASTINVESNNLTLSTTTSGDLVLSAADRVNIPQSTELSLSSDDAENIVSDGTDLTLSSGSDISLNPTNNVNITEGRSLSLSTDDAESLTSDGTDLTINSGADIILSPTANVNISQGQSLSFSTDDAERINSDGTDLNILSGGELTVNATNTSIETGSLSLPNGTSVNEFSTDGTLGDDSNNAVPTEQAVKTYVDNEVTNKNLQSAYVAGNTITTSSGEGLFQVSGDQRISLTTSESSVNAIEIAATNGDLDVDGTDVTIDATAGGLSMDATENSNFSMIANDPTDQTLTISASNTFGGSDSNIDINADGDLNVTTGGDVIVNGDIVDFTAAIGDINMTGAGNIDLVATAGEVTANKFSASNLTITEDVVFNEATNDLTLITADQSSGGGIIRIPDLNGADETILTNADIGTIASQDANSVNISGGSITGITDLAVADGGTGASTALNARSNLGLVIGTDVQAQDAGLQSISGLTTSADEMIYTTASDAYAVTSLTAAGRAILDDANAGAQRTTLGLAIGTDVQAQDAGLQSISGLTTAADEMIYTTASDAYAVTSLTAAGRAILDDADASAQRTTLGIDIGSDIQAWDQALEDISGLAVTDGNIIVGDGSNWVAETGATARTSLGLTIGTDVQAQDAGLQSISGLTTSADEMIYTTASDAYAVTSLTAAGRAILDDANAGAQRTTLGLAIGTDVQAQDAGLQSISGLTTAADEMIYTTASDAYAVTSLTAAGRAILDDADASAQRTTLGIDIGSDIQAWDQALEDISGLAVTDGNIIVGDGSNWVAETGATARTSLGLTIGTDVQAQDAGLQSISGLTTAADEMIYTTASDAYAVTSLTAAGRAILDDADASAQRTTLGIDIGSDIQAWDQALEDISGLAVTDGNIIVGDGSNWVAETGATARTSLGLTIGTDVQAQDAGLQSISGLTTSADEMIYTTASDAYAVTSLTAAGRAILDDANAGAQRTTLGLAIGTDVQAQDAGLQSISGLTTAADEMIYTTASDAYAVTSLTAAGRAILDDADASAQRTTLGIDIGSDIQAWDQALEDISGLAVTDGNIIVGDGSNWVAETGATARTSLGLTIGTDVQAQDAGLQSISGLTTSADEMIYTTASDAYAVTSLTAAGRAILDDANAGAQRTTLGLAIGTDVQAQDAGLQSISGLTTAADEMIYTTASDAYAVTSLTAAGRAILDDADASAQRTTLGIDIGSDIQAWDQALEDISGLAVTDGNIIVGDGSNWVAETGATARTSLGLTIGTDVQAQDAGLQSISGLTTSADEMIYTTASDAYAVTSLTAAGRAILDDANAGAQRTTLGLAIGTDVQAQDAGLQSISGLTTAADEMIYTTASDAYAVTSLTAAGRAILDDADASAQRTTLGIDIGSDIQAWDQALEDISGLAVTDGNIIVGDGSNWVAETGATARTSLGLTIGTDVQAQDAGLQSISGLTTSADEMIYTTASDAYAVTSLTAAGRAILDDANAGAQRTTLGLAIGTDVQAQDAGLQSISGLTTAADEMIYTTASDAYAVTSLTAAGRAILDDANAGAQRTTLGLAIGTDVQAQDAGLQSISGLTTAADEMIYTTASDAYAVTSLTAAGRAILDDADASAQRTTLGIDIGSDIQAWDQALEDISGLAVTDGNIIVGDGSNWVAETGATARTSLGLTIGTDVQAQDAGLQSISGLTTSADEMIYTTASDAYAVTSLTAAGRAILDDANAGAQRTTLGLAIGTDVQAQDAGLQSISGLTTSADEMIYTTASDAYAVTSLTAAGRAILDDANAGAQRTTLGLAIGTDVQAQDAGLQSISGLTTSADEMIYTTASDAYAVTSLTAAGRALLDDANASAQRTTLGLVIGTDVQAQDAGLQSISGLTTAVDEMIYTTASDAYAVTSLTAAGRALLDDANASAQRTTLGLAIGTDVQAQDAGLQSISGLTTAADEMIYTTASDAYAVTNLTAAGRAILDDATAGAQRTTLGLGTGDSPSFNGLTLSGIISAPGLMTDGSGNVMSSSDRRLKENINLLTNTIEKLNQLNGYNYNFISDEEKKKQIGVIAQELEKVYPELVTTREDGYKMVNYQGLIPVLIEAIKEQQNTISALANQVDNQNQKIDKLEAENTSIKSDVDEIKQLLGLKPNLGSNETKGE